MPRKLARQTDAERDAADHERAVRRGGVEVLGDAAEVDVGEVRRELGVDVAERALETIRDHGDDPRALALLEIERYAHDQRQALESGAPLDDAAIDRLLVLGGLLASRRSDDGATNASTVRSIRRRSHR